MAGGALCNLLQEQIGELKVMLKDSHEEARGKESELEALKVMIAAG